MKKKSSNLAKNEEKPCLTCFETHFSANFVYIKFKFPLLISRYVYYVNYYYFFLISESEWYTKNMQQKHWIEEEDDEDDDDDDESSR